MDMCGIIGGINIPGLVGALPTLLDVIAHRGPDAAGVFSTEGPGGPVTLGHRRLSVIDTSSGANQPFEKDGLVLVFNGEIYNFQQLANELRQLGVGFHTRSDTEVLLEAWRQWGADCLVRLRGMFAFALYDTATGRLVLARDPFGIKPLYILNRGRGLAFCSELKGLVPIMGERAEIDDEAVVASLIYGWLPDDYCLYRDKYKLPAGHWLEISSDGSVRQHAYWDDQALLRQNRPPVSVEELRAIIEDSVKLHMVADVPVYTFLSGGLDSSILSVLAKRESEKLESYTIAFRQEDMALEAMPDDLNYARQVARDNDIKLHEIEVTPDIANLLPKMADVLDEPVGDPAAINVYLICRAARQAGVKVLLSGLGADELFGGYRRHYACQLAARYCRLPGLLRRKIIRPLVDALPVAGESQGYRTIRWAKRFLSFADMGEEEAFMRSYTHYGRAELETVLGDRPTGDASESVYARHGALYTEGPSDDLVNRMCFTDMRLFMRGLNLFYSDRASMAASTEVRVPFIDTEMVKAAFAVSGDRKIVRGEQKYILKQAARAWLPKRIIHRPKASFNLPLRSWLRHGLREMVDDVLADGELAGRGYVNAAHIRRLIEDDRAGRYDYCREIWQLLTLELWFKAQRRLIAIGKNCFGANQTSFG
jgi:asparagine synthase (glutamine-hydrolysing)